MDDVESPFLVGDVQLRAVGRDRDSLWLPAKLERAQDLVRRQGDLHDRPRGARGDIEALAPGMQGEMV